MPSDPEPSSQPPVTFRTRRETKLFDPADGFSPFSDIRELTDPTIAKRGNQWWMFMAGQIRGSDEVNLYSASLQPGAPLSAEGWALTPSLDDIHRPAALAGKQSSQSWDGPGGRHCPNYARGWDPQRGSWVERIYYAGGSANVWGPYSIGFLEWDGTHWVDQPTPAFTANEDWEHGSVYEPNVIYSEGKWKLWYVAGSVHEKYIVQGFAESADGRAGWTTHKLFFPPHEQVFDFCVVPAGGGYDAIFSRLGLDPTKPTTRTGLWWCHCQTASANASDWSDPIQIMTAEDRGWHTGPWKPSFHYHELETNRLLVFFDGVYTNENAGPFPYVFTLGCLELERSR